MSEHLRNLAQAGLKTLGHVLPCFCTKDIAGNVSFLFLKKRRNIRCSTSYLPFMNSLTALVHIYYCLHIPWFCMGQRIHALVLVMKGHIPGNPTCLVTLLLQSTISMFHDVNSSWDLGVLTAT